MTEVKFPNQRNYNDPLPTVEEVKTFIGDHSEYSLERTVRNDDGRDIYTNYSWTILTVELVDALAELLKGKRVIDVACGNGALVYQLKQRGIDIVGIDNKTTHGFPSYNPDILIADSTSIQYGDYDAVLFVWPAYNQKEAGEILSVLDNQMVIYCGEGMGGCTGDEKFHDQLYDHYTDREVNLYPLTTQWMSIHDYWQVFDKKETN